MVTFGLSKTKIISGLQCPKRLYLQVHNPELAQYSGHAEYLVANGYLVGEVARGLHPEGRLVGGGQDFSAAIRQTREMLAADGDKLLFEPAFEHLGVAIKADLFFRRRGSCRLTEVKASSQVKGYHLNDVAIQRWVIEGAGYPLRSTVILHIDTSFVYQGDGDYRRLFKAADVTEEIESLLEQVPIWIKELRKVLAGSMPVIEVGPQCSDPFDCEFLDYCDRDSPEYPVSILPRAGKTLERLFALGYRDLRAVPLEKLDTARHKRVWRATRTGEPELDPQARDLVRAYPYPRFYLDFETVMFAVPIWAGTRPYETLPFQWSCHIETESGALTHKEFIGVSGQPPMRDFAESLIATLGEQGAVIVYGSFESTVLRKLIERFPDLEVPITRITRRIKNLLLVAQNCYYHRDMKGSWSLKDVLPTIAPDLDYSTLDEVQDGGMAQAAYAEAIDPATAPEHRDKLICALREYCKMDTLALVRITRFFAGA